MRRKLHKKRLKFYLLRGSETEAAEIKIFHQRNMFVESHETSDHGSTAHKEAHCSQSGHKYLVNKPLEERRFPASGSTPIFFSVKILR